MVQVVHCENNNSNSTLTLSMDRIHSILAKQGIASLMTPTVVHNAITLLQQSGLNDDNISKYATAVIDNAVAFAIIASAVEDKKTLSATRKSKAAFYYSPVETPNDVRAPGHTSLIMAR